MARVAVIVVSVILILTGCVHDRWRSSEFTVPEGKTQADYEAAKADCKHKVENAISKGEMILTGAVIYNRNMGRLYQSCMEGKGFSCKGNDCYY